MTTASPQQIHGEKRTFAYRNMTLDTNDVYQNLDPRQLDAARMLNIISAVWDRDAVAAMQITFTASEQAERYVAYCALRIEDCDDVQHDHASNFCFAVARQVIVTERARRYSCRITSDDTMAEVDGETVFATLDGYDITIKDIHPALEAIFRAVSSQSETITRTRDI